MFVNPPIPVLASLIIACVLGEDQIASKEWSEILEKRSGLSPRY
jgi:hypothetical protein